MLGPSTSYDWYLAGGREQNELLRYQTRLSQGQMSEYTVPGKKPYEQQSLEKPRLSDRPSLRLPTSSRLQRERKLQDPPRTYGPADLQNRPKPSYSLDLRAA